MKRSLLLAAALAAGVVGVASADAPFDYSGRTAVIVNAPSEATGSNAAAIAALHYSSTSVTGLKQLGMMILFR